MRIFSKNMHSNPTVSKQDVLPKLFATLRLVGAVAVSELRLQMRTRTLWIICMVSCAAIVLQTWYLASRPLINQEVGTIVVDAFPSVESLLLLLLPFLVLNIFERDQRRKVYKILWSRPLITIEYVFGKALALLIINLVLLLPVVCSGWVTLSITWRTAASLTPWLALLPYFVTNNTLVTFFALFCVILLPLSLLGVCISVGVVAYLTLFRLRSLILWPNLTGINLFYSPSIGFGLDNGLLQGQFACFLSLTLLTLGLLLLAFLVRERKGITYLRHVAASGLLIALACGLFFSAFTGF